MIDVQMTAHTNAHPKELAEFAGLICYSSEVPVLGQEMGGDHKKILWDAGHMTPYQHWYATFLVDGISVYDITLGFHLTSPFYNSCQRSGRYCRGMFDNPDYKRIRKYLRTYWPDIPSNSVKEIMDYVRYTTRIYLKNKPKADEVAYRMLKESRPKIPQKTLETQSPKKAQEQLRVFYPMIFPTCFAFTINLTSIAALYASAWTPAMRDVTEKMVQIIRGKYPDFKIFDGLPRQEKDWAPEITSSAPETETANRVSATINEVGAGVWTPTADDLSPVDLLHFNPDFMDNRLTTIESEVRISAITMGQDQRHRTIARSKPWFTNRFFVPPVVEELDLKSEALQVIWDWNHIGKNLPATAKAALTPYGSMVTYVKLGDLNGIAHEQEKRLCDLAQSEISNCSVLLRRSIEEKCSKGDFAEEILGLLEAPCRPTGVCTEPARFCGRVLSKKARESEDFYSLRLI